MSRIESASPDQIIEKLVEAVCPPEDRRAAAGPILESILEAGRSWHAWNEAWQRDAPMRAKARNELSELERLAIKLVKKLDALSVQARQRLGLHAIRRERWGDGGTDAQRRFQLADLVLVENGAERARGRYGAFRKIADDLRVAAAFEAWPSNGGTPSKSPALTGNPKVKALDLFVCELRRYADAEGWRVTVDKETGGTLRVILKTAAPLLPPGIIPPQLIEPDTEGGFKGISRLARLWGSKKRETPPRTNVRARTGQKRRGK